MSFIDYQGKASASKMLDTAFKWVVGPFIMLYNNQGQPLENWARN